MLYTHSLYKFLHMIIILSGHYIMPYIHGICINTCSLCIYLSPYIYTHIYTCVAAAGSEPRLRQAERERATQLHLDLPNAAGHAANICIYLSLYTYTHIYIYICITTCVCMYIYLYIHTYTYISKHTTFLA